MHTCEQAKGATVREVTCVWAKFPECSFEDICANRGGCGYATAGGHGGLMELEGMTCEGTITNIEELLGDVEVSCDMRFASKSWLLMAAAGILLLAGLFWLVCAIRSRSAAAAVAVARSKKLEERRRSSPSARRSSPSASFPPLPEGSASSSTSANGTSRSSSACSSSTGQAQSQSNAQLNLSLQLPARCEEMMQPRSDLEACDQESPDESPEASQDEEPLPSAMSAWRSQQLSLQLQLRRKALETQSAAPHASYFQERGYG